MGEIGDLLRKLDITPVLMDVGASGGPPPILNAAQRRLARAKAAAPVARALRWILRRVPGGLA